MKVLENVWRETVEDLLDWEEENDTLLPWEMTAEDIADLEEDGFIVDLMTGEIFADPDAEAQL